MQQITQWHSCLCSVGNQLWVASHKGKKKEEWGDNGESGYVVSPSPSPVCAASEINCGWLRKRVRRKKSGVIRVKVGMLFPRNSGKVDEYRYVAIPMLW